MEPALIKTMIEVWGPISLIIVGGWFALKWLAQRDDERNKTMTAMIEKMTDVVANNTRALDRFSTIEGDIIERLKGKAPSRANAR